MRLSILILFSLFIVSISSAQTIKRWNGGKKEISSKQITVETRLTVFKDFGWSKPDIKSREINFVNAEYKFTFKNLPYLLSKVSDEEIILSSGQLVSVKASKKISQGDLYPNKNWLQLKPVTRQRWAPYYTTTTQSVPVIRYRNITTYQYDYNSKTTRPVYRTESYTAYEIRIVPRTEWRWTTYIDYELNIPQYEYYSFLLQDGSQLLVYEITNDNEKKYYIQNSSYLSAIDKDGINHVIIDNDVNGNYTDPLDQLFLNSWNPYSEKSSYKKIPFSIDNSWYSLNFLQDEYFISTSIENNLLSLNYKNDEYKNSEEKGIINFDNFPPDAKIEINGKNYKIKSSKNYKSEYGFFKLRMSRPGYLDFETTYIVNNNVSQTIHYIPTGEAATFKIKNIFTNDFFIVVQAENYYKTYYNTKEIQIPLGENKIEIYTDGSSFIYPVTAESDKKIEIDFEAEIQKKKE